MRYKNFIFFYLIIICPIANSCSGTKKIFESGNAKNFEKTEIINLNIVNDLPFCKVNINGKTYNFKIDTGAPTVISSEIYNDLNLKPYFEREVKDTNSKKRKLIFSILPEIKIGNLTFEKIGILVLDSEVQEVKCFGFDGIIGANLLAKLNWKFNYSEKQLTASNNFEDFEQKYDFSVPFEMSNQKTPKIKGKILNKDLIFTFDSGFNGKLQVSNDFKNYQYLVSENHFISKKGKSAIGIFGDMKDENSFSLKSDLCLENQIFKDEIIDSGTSSLIGNEFLKRYIFTIDWKQQKIYFKKVAEKEETLKSFGFSYLFVNGKPTVVSKFENQNIPIELNDEILKINNVDFTKIKNDEICKYYLNKVEKNLDEIEITIKRKDEVLTYKLQKREFLK